MANVKGMFPDGYKILIGPEFVVLNEPARSTCQLFGNGAAGPTAAKPCGGPGRGLGSELMVHFTADTRHVPEGTAAEDTEAVTESS